VLLKSWAFSPREGVGVRRREFITLLGATALAWPPRARAQQAQGFPLIGLLNSSSAMSEFFLKSFRRDMRVLGWEEGRNIRVIRRWPKAGEGMPELARDLVAQGVSVIFAGAGDPAIRAAQQATASLAIVGMTDDMVDSGLVASLAHPGGNTTGVSILASQLDVKRLELLHELVPKARRIGILADPTTVSTSRQLESAATDFGIELSRYFAADRDEIHAATEAMVAARVEAINVLASPILNAAHGYIIKRLAEAAIPAVYQWPESAEEGGLMGYGPRITLCYRHAAVLIDKILRGAKPGDLPVEQPSVFTLVINLRTANALGLSIPPLILIRADELIE
jgi:putative tryptophan/tyrosine transport system substrate-binding protein